MEVLYRDKVLTYMTARVAVGLAGPPESVEKLSLAHSMHGSALSCPMLYTSASLDIKANLHLIGLLAQNAVDHNEPGKTLKGIEASYGDCSRNSSFLCSSLVPVLIGCPAWPAGGPR